MMMYIMDENHIFGNDILFTRILFLTLEMVVDTTGAGDAFSGALVCFLVEKPELELG